MRILNRITVITHMRSNRFSLEKNYERMYPLLFFPGSICCHGVDFSAFDVDGPGRAFSQRARI